jgi:hypothetical protein
MYSEMTILHTTGGARESVEYVHLVQESDQRRGEISGSTGQVQRRLSSDVSPSTLVESERCFRGTYCTHNDGDRTSEIVFLSGLGGLGTNPEGICMGTVGEGVGSVYC